MIDNAKIKSDYENLKRVQYTELLPLKKVLELEQAKEDIEVNMLSKIEKIFCKDNKYSLKTSEGFTLVDLLNRGAELFGDMNYVDKNNDGTRLSIDIAYTYSMIGMVYENDKFRYSVTVFWDI